MSTTITKTKEKLSPNSLKVKDITIEKGCIYQVSPKYDGSAPDGFKKERTTKFLSSHGKNIEAVPFDTRMGVWDTGLYEESPCYAGMPKVEVKRLVNSLQESIVKPIEARLGIGKLDYKEENTFWLDYGIDLHRGRIFNTEQPDQLLQLFQVAIHGKVAPKGSDSNPNYREAQFCVENKEEAKTIQQENDTLEINAMGSFYSLLKGEKDVLALVMNYVGIPLPGGKNLDEQVAASAFKVFVDHKSDGYTNKTNFLKAVKLSGEKTGYKELAFYEKIQKLIRKKKIEKERENFLLDGDVLGTNPKEIAKKVARNAELQERILALE